MSAQPQVAEASKGASFPALASSPYRIEGSKARERYWFSDGVWLDQGPTAAVVGFVWTHWLADRGIQAPGVEFNEQFARDLYGASQRMEGGVEDEQAGAQLWAAARVLQSRGLIEEAYACEDVDTIVLALLERGPVVAALEWQEAMGAPEETEIGMVCRVQPNAPPVGGHSVLLNGVTLDGQHEGTTGFIRFKNSWGRSWGDGGQCLISIEDLSIVVNGSQTLLPIPTSEALGRSGHQDVAILEGTEPELVRYEQESIGGDLWTILDTVGYSAYVDAIARGIQHPDTKPPLTIGIKAPWGAGKTSLMRMIRERLEWPTAALDTDERRPPRPIHLTDDSRKALSDNRTSHSDEAPASQLPAVTYGDVLRELRSPRPPADADAAPKAPAGRHTRLEAQPEQAAGHQDNARWRPTVWFNPWMYQTGEQVWAGLAHEIISQTTARMSRGERERFWLRLNRKRIDEEAVRRKVYGFVLDRVLPLGIACLVALIVGLVLLAVDAPHGLGVAFAGGSPAALIALGGWQTYRALGTKLGGSLNELVAPATRASQLAREQLSGSFDELVRSPDYRSQSGFLYLVQTDMQHVLDLVATPEHPLVVFVDDLDRCSPSTVVQVIEAVNVFLTGEWPNAIFVIAMEPEMVAAHIEAAYADLVKTLEERSGTSSGGSDLAWKFLEKIVQLPLTLPNMDPERKRIFYESLFQPEAAPGPPSQAQAAASEADVQAAGQRLAGATFGEVVKMAGRVGAEQDAESTAAEKEAIRRFVERRLSRDSPEVQKVIAYGGRFLDPNPREIKRYVNLFRFFAMIHTERTIAGLPTVESLDGLAKLAVISTRWPSLVAVLEEPVGSLKNGRTVLDVLENPPVTTPRKGESRAAAELRGVKRAFATGDLSASMTDRLLANEVRTFMRSDPKVGAAGHAYL